MATWSPPCLPPLRTPRAVFAIPILNHAPMVTIASWMWDTMSNKGELANTCRVTIGREAQESSPTAPTTPVWPTHRSSSIPTTMDLPHKVVRGMAMAMAMDTTDLEAPVVMLGLLNGVLPLLPQRRALNHVLLFRLGLLFAATSHLRALASATLIAKTKGIAALIMLNTVVY